MADHRPTGELSRELSLFHITMMGLGMMIGAGVFLGMGISIHRAGPGGLMLTFALNGLLAILTAMSFAELSSAIPRAGGAYNFARIGFGRPASFLAGWMEWFASSVAGAMYALTVSLYTIRYFHAMGWMDWLLTLTGVDPASVAAKEVLWNATKVMAVLTALIFLYINYRGASETGKIGAIITLGQTLFVIVIGIVGIFTVAREPHRLNNFQDFMPNGWLQLLVTMGFTYVAFEGYEVIAQAGDEAIEPRKNLPKAMLYSVAIVTVIYVLVAFATVVSVHPNDPDLNGIAVWQWIGSHQEKGFGEAVAKLMPFGNIILTFAVIFSATSALNATIYSATRASYALGRDQMLPPLFAKIHSVRKTPYGALLATACIVLIVTTALPTKDVASSASIMFLFLFFMVNLCVIKIRRSMADELIYGFLMPLFPLFPILAVLCQTVLAVWLIHMSLIAWIIAPCWIVLGVATYFLYSRSRVATGEHEIHVLEESKYEKPDEDRYPVMVAVANPANAAELVKSTYRLCAAKNAQVELLHMVSVPSQISLRDAQEHILPGKEAITEAMLYLSMHFPISTTLRYCRNIARGIVSAVREKHTKMLVLGWHGQRPNSIFKIGSTVDPIMEQVPCNVAILKDCGGNKVFKNVLVPVAGGPNGALALEIANILADDEEGRITAFTVDTGRGKFDLDNFLESDRVEKLEIPSHRLSGKTVEGKSPVVAILREARKYDLVVLGTTHRSSLLQMTSQSLPEKIACRCNKPTVIVKANVGVRSWLKRWISA